jgi:hypothetical protein
MVSVGRALGDKGRDAVSAARRESENSLEVRGSLRILRRKYGIFPPVHLPFSIPYQRSHSVTDGRFDGVLIGLQRLHVQLGLPPEALQADQNTIEAAIRNAVTSLF